MRKIQPSFNRSTTWAALGLVCLLAVLGSSFGSRQSAESTRNQLSTNQSIPQPIGTYVGATSTPELIAVPSIEAKLPPPPAADIIAVDTQAVAPNIAWGVEAPDNLTVWVGRYSETLGMTDARPITKWKVAPDSPMRIADISVSPDHNSIAVLLSLVCVPSPLSPTPDLPAGEVLPNTDAHVPCQQGSPQFLYIISLTNNQVQNVPDYDERYDLYEELLITPILRIVGWMDNNRVAFEYGGIPMTYIAVATKDGTAISLSAFPPGYATQLDTTLLPDGQNFLSVVSGDGSTESGLWTYDLEGRTPRKLVDLDKIHSPYEPALSPDGKYVSFRSPKDSSQFEDMGIWLLDLTTMSEKVVTMENTWNSVPVWSPGGSQLVFLQADVKPKTPKTLPDNIATNVFVVDAKDLKPRKLTKFADKENRDLQWTSDGNLIAASTAFSTDSTLDLVAIKVKDGKPEKLSKKTVPSSAENVVHPVVFK